MSCCNHLKEILDACKNGDLEFIKKQKYIPRAICIIRASVSNQIKIVKYLLQLKQKKDNTTITQLTHAIYCAIRENNYNIATYLIKFYTKNNINILPHINKYNKGDKYINMIGWYDDKPQNNCKFLL